MLTAKEQAAHLHRCLYLLQLFQGRARFRGHVPVVGGHHHQPGDIGLAQAQCVAQGARGEQREVVRELRDYVLMLALFNMPSSTTVIYMST